MIIKTVVLILLLVIIGSCQTMVPRYLVWDKDYTGEDSLDIVFDNFRGIGISDTSYFVFDTTQVHYVDLLEFNFLYSNMTRFFYVRARRLSDGAVSLNSDTVSAFFPVILPNRPYEYKVLKVKLP